MFVAGPVLSSGLFPIADQRRCLMGLLVCTGLLAGEARARGEDSRALLERFQAEAPAGWAKLDDAESTLESVVHFHMKTTYTKNGTVDERDWSITWRRLAGCRLVDRTDYREGKVWRHVVTAMNDQYYFKVKPQNEKSNEWQLQDYGPADSSDVESHKFHLYRAHLSPTASYFNATRLLELVREPTFRAEDAQREGELVRVRFSYTHKPSPNEPGYPARGALVCDPALSWAVLQWDYTSPLEGGLHSVYKNELSEQTIDGYRPVRSASMITTTPTCTTRLDVTVESIGKTRVTPAAFRLSAYGLPEPSEFRPDQRAKYFLFGGAALCACLTLVLWRIARRRKSGAIPGSGVRHE
jgi:hypothetical protein